MERLNKGVAGLGLASEAPSFGEGGGSDDGMLSLSDLNSLRARRPDRPSSSSRVRTGTSLLLSSATPMVAGQGSQAGLDHHHSSSHAHPHGHGHGPGHGSSGSGSGSHAHPVGANKHKRVHHGLTSRPHGHAASHGSHHRSGHAGGQGHAALSHSHTLDVHRRGFGGAVGVGAAGMVATGATVGGAKVSTITLGGADGSGKSKVAKAGRRRRHGSARRSRSGAADARHLVPIPRISSAHYTRSGSSVAVGAGGGVSRAESPQPSPSRLERVARLMDPSPSPSSTHPSRPPSRQKNAFPTHLSEFEPHKPKSAFTTEDPRAATAAKVCVCMHACVPVCMCVVVCVVLGMVRTFPS